MRTLNSATESRLVVTMLPPLSPVSMLATPSIVTLLEFGRWPFTVKPPAEPISVPSAVLDRARHERHQVEELPRRGGDVREGLALQRERALPARRLDLGHAARDADLFRHLPTSSVSVPVVILSLALTTTFVRSSVLKPCSATWSV